MHIASSFLLAALFVSATSAQTTPAHTFTAAGDHFALDGKPFQIISGEMHYPRIPREYWRDRLEKAHAMGLNTVTVYAFWNVHEEQPGVFDFSGQKDVAEFIHEAQQEGLYVVLRPGPYVCAEWEFGGFPAWLKKDHDLQLRTRDAKYLAAAHAYLKRLGQELAPLQIGNGGPIIAVQVENEYGSFGNDHGYMNDVKQALIDAGFTKAMLYTADGPEQIPNGSLPGLPIGINYGTGDAHKAIEYFKKTYPGKPIFNSEYWDGWFDHWGAKHETRDGKLEAEEIAYTLQQGGSISLYMEEGGTSFGWMNGANSDGKNYEPDVTSYDYDVPLDESGRPREKYFLFRDVITKATGVKPPPVPVSPPTISVAPAVFSEAISLWDTLPAPVSSEKILSMEDIGQAYGYILYRTTVKAAGIGQLKIDALHDYAQVYVDGKLAGTIDRRLDESALLIRYEAGSRIDLLVENTGRVNYGKNISEERAGITRQVLLNNVPLTNWSIYPLPMDNPSALPLKSAACEDACFCRAQLQLETPGDTFLDTSQLGKGQLWINGHNLGRFWDVGPLHTLYVPGPWLHSGSNEVVIFDLKGAPGRSVSGLAKPILNGAVK
jgi:beta-galactosidase